MVRALLVPVDSDIPVQECALSELDDYQAALDGWIEPVDVPSLGVTIYVNEEGLLRQMPLNPRATFLWWLHEPVARQKAMLVGLALIVGIPDQNGDSTDVPHALLKTLTNAGVWRVEVQTVGDPKWYRNQATYTDYFEAVVWAMVTLERGSAAEDVRIVPVESNDAPGGVASSFAP